MNHLPPKWADKFLNWYCNSELLEEIQGDAYELYERRLERYGKRNADRKYIWDVLKFFRWSNIKKTQNKYQNSNQIPMFKNYIKVGYRNIAKNRVTSIVNILGLAIAVGCAITTFIFIDHQLNMDSFHSNKDNIYQIINHVQNDDATEMWGDSPLLLGPAIKDKYPSINQVARIEYQYGSIKSGNDVFNELISFVDPEFLKMFDYPMLSGNRKDLFQKENIVIGDIIAEKYFGEEDPVGKRLSIKFQNGKTQVYYVKGVLAKMPYNASYRPQILLPIQNFFDLKLSDNYTWDYLTDATFISLTDGSNPSEINMDEFVKVQNESNTEWTTADFELINLTQLSRRSFEISSSVSRGSHPSGMIALGSISFFLLILACFNYMNIAVASATKRLKEIAIRKVMGSARRNIISQFLIENVLLCLVALGIGVLFSYFLFLPGFDMIVPEMDFPFTFSSIYNMLGFFVGLFLLIGLLSGAYPALYISKFEPVDIFKGNQKFGSKNLLSRILLTFQLFFAISTVVGCFVFVDNAIYLNNKDWGYDPAGIISIAVNNESDFIQLKNEALKNPSIKGVAGSYGHIAVEDAHITLDYLEKHMRIVRYKVDENYLPTSNVRLLEGHFFEQENEENAIVVNEAFVEKMDWDEPLEESIVYDGIRRNVIGVVQNFHYDYFYSEIYPVMFISGVEKNFNYLIVKTSPENVMQVDKYLESTWHKIVPEEPYDRAFQTDVFNYAYRENKANIYLLLVISGIAILLACLGLFGLLSFNLQKKMKEYSVRKVLGASTMNIVKLANKEYAWTLIISFVLGAPSGYYFINQLTIQVYTEPRAASMLPFASAIIIILVTFALTVSTQIWKATKVNPAEILKSE